MKRLITSMVIIGTIFLMPNIVKAQETTVISVTTGITQTESTICPYQNKIWESDFYIPLPERWHKVPSKERLPYKKRLPNKDILFPKNMIDGRIFV